tara:strand:+ start:25 stop:1155 length:1131 start_codon:yes stop_codon:yes gene_type:complete
MYDKKKTIKGYMGGGYMKPMGYQTGGYIPGLSRARYLTGLDRDKRIAQEEFNKQAEKLSKEQFWRGLAGKAGSFGGSLLGAALAAPTGGMSVLAGKAIGTAIGRGAGELVGGSLVDAGNIKQSSTGLYKDDFDYLRKQGRKTEDLGSLAKRSIGEGAATYAGGKFNEFLDARMAEAKIDRKVFDPSTDGAIIPEQSDFLVDNGSSTDKAFNELRARESVSRDELYETLESNPMMSYEESLRGSDRLGSLNTSIADINEAEALRNQASSRSLNNFIKEFGDIPSAQKYRDRASSFADIIQRLESELEPATGEQRPLASLQTLLQQYPEQSSLSGDSSNLDFMEAAQRRLRGYKDGGQIEEYGHGGLIDMNPFSRRIL